ncbi:unnamed protein product [Cylicostephanus goldi]|uniref:glutathione transferase n=1 Tax=Cylicostephanus goldi TaxID=71465 RepID=A0A3P6TEM6_CYLGO|nr:unnamed protein product [Cylicostephanus goldi]
MPFGQLPVLEVDLKEVAESPDHKNMPGNEKTRKLAQSFAIARFLAKQFGLSPKCPFEEALVDSLMDQYKDFMNEIRPLLMVVMGFAQGDIIGVQLDKGSCSKQNLLIPQYRFTMVLLE